MVDKTNSSKSCEISSGGISSESIKSSGSVALKPFEKDTLEENLQREAGCFSKLKDKICAFLKWLLSYICCRTSQEKAVKPLEKIVRKAVEEEVSSGETVTPATTTGSAEKAQEVSSPSETHSTVSLTPVVKISPSEKEAFGKAENYLVTRAEDLDLVKYKEFDKATQLCILFILACDENFDVIDRYYRVYGSNKTYTTVIPLNLDHIRSGDLDIKALPLSIMSYFENDRELLEKLENYKAVKDSEQLWDDIQRFQSRSYIKAQRFFKDLQGRTVTEQIDIDNFDKMDDVAKLLIIAFCLTSQNLEKRKIHIFYPRIERIFKCSTASDPILQVGLLKKAKEILSK